MATESSVGLAADGPGKKVDTCEVTTSQGVVERQVTVCADPTDASARCAVRADGGWQSGDYSLAVHVRQLLDVAIAVAQPLRHLARALTLAPDPSTGRIRILLDAISASLTLATVTTVTTCTTVTTVTTCSTVTTVNQLAGFDVKQTLMYAQERSAWANTVRARIT